MLLHKKHLCAEQSSQPQFHPCVASSAKTSLMGCLLSLRKQKALAGARSPGQVARPCFSNVVACARHAIEDCAVGWSWKTHLRPNSLQGPCAQPKNAYAR